MIRLKWFLQVLLSLGIKYAKVIHKECGLSIRSTYFDIVYCCLFRGVVNDQYYKYRLFEKSPEEKKTICDQLRKDNMQRCRWEKSAERERRFFVHYGKAFYDIGVLRFFRCHAYKKRYHAGEFFYVERNVEISRQHFLDGEISIGHDVLICKNSILDYSGELILEDHVSLSEGTVVYSHSHFNSLYNKMAGIKDKADPEPSRTVIKSGAWIGANCIIMPGVTIGEDAIIMSGCVITHDILPKSIVSPAPVEVRELRRKRRAHNEAKDKD